MFFLHKIIDLSKGTYVRVKTEITKNMLQIFHERKSSSTI